MSEEERSTLERIHAAAMAEFLEKGFQGASLRSIVKAAGVTTGALYGYYNSKAELFQALVRKTYDYIMRTYQGALDSFEQLPEAEQPSHMGQAGRRCMEDMLCYAREHTDELRLLLQCSEGTRYAFLVEDIVELEKEATLKYCGVLRKLGHPVPAIDQRLSHVLVTSMMNAYFEMLLYEMPIEDAKRYLRELNDFYTAGWLKIMGQ